MARKTYAVIGATGHIGKVVVARLLAAGHEVRPVSRSEGVDLDDAASLKRAFAGADGALLMIPPDMTATDLRRHQNEVGEKLAQAVTAAGTRRVVFLSSAAAHLPQGTGPVLGLHDMEERLNNLGLAELVHVRPVFFMENHFMGLHLIAEQGLYGTAFRPDVPIPMIATRDIGERAADFLTEEPFREPPARELLGPRDYTMVEATRILGSAIGKPNLRYVQFPYDKAHEAMTASGMSASNADAMSEMFRNFNEGRFKPTEKRSAVNTTSTKLEQFAEQTFRPAYEALAAAVH